MADKYKAKQGVEEPWGRTASSKGKCAQFMEFLYNSERKEFLGRTSTSWMKIGIFYVIYYALLCGFWAAMYIIFLQTIDETVPKWIAENGLIGGSPGLGFRPTPHHDSVESTLIWIKSEKESWMFWKNSTEKFMKPYEQLLSQSGEYVKTCDDDQIWAEDLKACFFDIKDLGNWCHSRNNYGYDQNFPCVMLKLNKIYGWKPDYYKDYSELPDNMPEDLKQKINDSILEDGSFPSRIWVWCEGENPADKENIGSLKYFPFPGFHSHYYPYMRVPGYKSPIVAVQFEKPKTGVLMNIECRAWAKNIKHSRMERLGMVHFEILID